MLIANATGAVLGPLFVWLTSLSGITNPFFTAIGICFSLSFVWTALRIVSHPSPSDHFEAYENLPKTTQSIVDMDPRTEHDSSELVN